MQKKTVAVGLSGGVDSSVSAMLLKRQGFNVIGLFMKCWEDTDKNCTAKEDAEIVNLIAKQIDIPIYTINFTKEYKEEVFNKFLSDCKKGLTPNPDILCNSKIKFHHFYRKAKQLKADFLATGHYCQVRDNQILMKGKDPNKDQSYFLYAINPDVLKDVIFPIGTLDKSKVRMLAKEFNLINHDRKDSTGICFIGKKNFASFLSQYIGFTPGDIVDDQGNKLGNHNGLAYFTLGQRKGMKIGGPGDAWFVVKKDLQNNRLIIAQGQDHLLLYQSSLIAKDLNWFKKPLSLPFQCAAKIRYRQSDQKCTIEKLEDDQLFVTFNQPQRAITKGQSIVFYQEYDCLGGGIIS
jgi:tRNA-uridine 2-sulfurtransferase